MRRAADSTEPGRARPCPAVLRGVMGARRDDLLSEGGVGADRAREDEAAEGGVGADRAREDEAAAIALPKWFTVLGARIQFAGRKGVKRILERGQRYKYKIWGLGSTTAASGRCSSSAC